MKKFNLTLITSPLLLLLLLLTITACITQKPPAQYPDEPRITLAILKDTPQTWKISPAPEILQKNILNELEQKQLKNQILTNEELNTIFSNQIDTRRRIAALKNHTKQNNLIILIETQASFYSLLNGRYRWTVELKMTIIDPQNQSQDTESYTIPTTLAYAHQDENDALNTVAPEIAKKLSAFIDRFMRGRNNTPQDTNNKPPENLEPQSTTPTKSSDLQSFYFIIVDRFNDTAQNQIEINKNDPQQWFGGDIQGITEKLDYLQKLGIKTLWLSPIFKTQHDNFMGHAAFHAYWTEDLSEIDPQFGTENDLKNLASELKKRNMNLILDYVVNHTGYQAPQLKTNPDWYNEPNTITDWNDEYQLTHYQVHGLPDLNQNNPQVYNYITNNALKWMDIDGIIGLRLDAVKHVPLPFWKKFNADLKAKQPNAILLAEDFNGSPQNLNNTLKNADFTHIFDFPLAFALRDHYCQNHSPTTIATILSNDRLYDDTSKLVTFLDNHDIPRFLSLCNEDPQKLKNALTTLIALRGNPCIYYGTEALLSGKDEPLNRSPMDFNNTPLYDHIQKLLELKNNSPALQNAKSEILEANDNILIIRLFTNKQQALLIITHQNQITASIPNANWINPLDNQHYNDKISLQPNTTTLLLANTNNQKPLSKNTLQITFKIDPNLAKNDTFALAGSSPELAVWNPDNAPKLSPQNNHQITLEIPQNMAIHYKLVKINGNNKIWENTPNRYIFTTKTQTITMTPNHP